MKAMHKKGVKKKVNKNIHTHVHTYLCIFEYVCTYICMYWNIPFRCELILDPGVHMDPS